MSVLVLVTQSGADVVAAATGSVDLSDLTYVGLQAVQYDWGHYIGPTNGSFVLGAGLLTDVYAHIDGPSSFGNGGAIAWTNSGDVLAVGNGYLGVAWGYVSGTPITGVMSYLDSTYQNETLFSLGLTPGTYLYTWGAGAHADSLTLRIGDSVATPEPATWMLLLLGFVVLGRRAWKSVRQS